MEKEIIEKLIKKYDLSKLKNDELFIGIFLDRKFTNEEKETIQAEVMSYKEDIIKYFDDEKAKVRAELERRENIINSIEGLVQIREKRIQASQWRREFNQNMENEYTSSIPPKTPYPSDLTTLEEKYPDAVFVLKVYGEKLSHNYEVSEIAEKTMEKLYAGCTIAEMRDFYNQETAKFVEAHLWD